MRALMVQGTSSWAGKSLIATALCRHFARLGVRVAPFKAQNMSNNARVVAGGEIGTAQYLQALAARVEPEVRMNPVLLKPEAETRSQVVLHGVADPELSAVPWRERADLLWPAVAESLRSLLDEYELVVLEGAGSPAEINLAECDMTNLRAAEAADAGVLMVCDIDRGGAFAHLYGTWALMEPAQRERIGGFVLNKFRGDPGLLPPAPERLTGADRRAAGRGGAVAAPRAARRGRGCGPGRRVRRRAAAGRRRALPDRLQPRRAEAARGGGGPALLLSARRAPRGRASWFCPDRNTSSPTCAWLRERGFEPTLREHVADGRRLLGICGGMQMLGRELQRPGGSRRQRRGARAAAAGHHLRGREAGRPHAGAASRRSWRGRGRRWPASSSTATRSATAAPPPEGAAVALEPGLGWADGPVLGIAPHGIFEQPEVLAALLGTEPEADTLEPALEELTDAVVAALDMNLVEQLAGLKAI